MLIVIPAEEGGEAEREERYVMLLLVECGRSVLGDGEKGKG